MRHLLPFLCCGLIFCFGCADEPAVKYTLTAEQLAWQPYRSGQVFRFGRNQSNQVRTYRITEVQDRLEKQYVGGSWLPLPSKKAPLCQHVTVLAQRIDSIAEPQVLFDLELYYDPGYREVVLLGSDASWETLFDARLPIDSVNAGRPIDSLYYPGIRLLPTASFGPATYTQVLEVKNRYPQSVPASRKLTRLLYYARNQGVVAFVEDGTGLWYRTP